MNQHSYTVDLCKNICAEAHFRTKGSVWFSMTSSGVISPIGLFVTGQLRNPWQMLMEPLGSAEPRLKITELFSNLPKRQK